MGQQQVVHGRDRQAVRATVAQATAQAGLASRPQALLFSLRRFKQTGARRFAHLAPSNSIAASA